MSNQLNQPLQNDDQILRHSVIDMLLRHGVGTPSKLFPYADKIVAYIKAGIIPE